MTLDHISAAQVKSIVKGWTEAMLAGTQSTIIDATGRHHQGTIVGFRMESGSGRTWLVSVMEYPNEIFCQLA